MGLGPGYRDEGYGFAPVGVPPNMLGREPNPDPTNFSIERIEQIGDCVVAEVHYPDCTNYEGRKIILWRNTPVDMVRGWRVLDPHFHDGFPSPFARFEPTHAGWAAARVLARALTPKETS